MDLLEHLWDNVLQKPKRKKLNLWNVDGLNIRSDFFIQIPNNSDGFLVKGVTNEIF